MIDCGRPLGKMLHQFLLISLCCAAAYGSGQLTVLEAPKALDFVHTDAPLATDSLADLYAAALGHSVAGSDNWSGLRINDPFNAPLLAVAFVIPTLKTNLQLAAAPARYQLSGAGVQAALATLDARVQTEYIDLAAVAAETKTDAKQTDAKFVALKPESNAAERKFVAVTAAIARFADNVELSPSAAPLFVSAVVATEGLAASSDLAQTEARKLLQQAVQQATAALQKKFGDAVLVTLVEHDAAEPQQLQRQKRQAAAGSETDNWNLAEDYNEDYPVVFNIILWFGVVMVFTLVAISYAIGTMDPGRDSIIYRMTSTRMKKEN